MEHPIAKGEGTTVIRLIILGTTLAGGQPEWSRLRGVAVVLVLVAIVIGIGLVSFRPWSGNSSVRRRSSGQKVPKSLVGLSSAAILAIYAAGYHRTSSAEDRFAEQGARRRTTVPLAAAAVAPETVASNADTAPNPSPSPLAPRKTVHPQPSPPATPKPAPVAAPAENSSLTPAAPEAPPKGTAPNAAPTNPSASQPAAPPRDVAANNVATTNPPAAQPAALTPSGRQAKYKDGIYAGWGSSRHGDIQASVLIQGGQIAAAEIAQCQTRYPCTWIADLPALVVSKQSADVDFVSGATESSDAFSDAVAQALSKAQ